MHRHRTRSIPFGAAIALAAVGLAACSATTAQPGSSGPAGTGPATSGPAATQPATSQSASGAAASATPASCPGSWLTGPVTVTHSVAVPPVPVATDIRTGTHPFCKFDRLVIDFSGALPGYSARFVATVKADGSGKPVTVPGTRFLVISFTPAQGHTDAGHPTLTAAVRTVGDRMLRGYAVSGDFEGVLSIALGLAGGTSYRVGELANRVYVDVAW